MTANPTALPTTSTLDTPRVADLVTRLFAEAEASNTRLHELFGAMSPEERRRRMTDPTADYREFYGLAKELYLAVSPETARLLYLLARANGARAIVEFGTSFGISTIHLAAALRDNDDGRGGFRLIGSDLEPAKVAQARANLAEAGLDDLVDVREGDALETLAKDLPRPSMSSCSTATSRSTRTSSSCSRRGCAPARAWWRTTWRPAPNTCDACARLAADFSRYRSPTTSSSP